MSNKPRPYSTLVDGRIVWVNPEETRTKKARSRLETDQELRARVLKLALLKGFPGWDACWHPGTLKHLSGADLDKFVARWSVYDLTTGYVPLKREWVDEVCE